mgnify:CR=1 FL=1
MTDKRTTVETFELIGKEDSTIVLVNGGNLSQGLYLFNLEIQKSIALKNNFQLIPEIMELIKWSAFFAANKAANSIKAEGVPNIFKQILSLDRKRNVENFCAGLTISHKEFSSFIANCDQLGFSVKSHHDQIVPKDLETTSSERTAFILSQIDKIDSPGSRKFIKKTSAMFFNRKNINVHLFEKNNEWHIFYFTYDDINARAKNKQPHWAKGDHIRSEEHTSELQSH